MVKDPHVYRDGDAPTPFTPEEIREGCPAGRLIRLRVDKPTGETMIRVIRFVEVDEEKTVQEARSYEPDGSEHDEPTKTSPTWVELQSHASFPLEKTSIDREMRDTPLGYLECLRYAVVEGSTTDIYWFALSLPGMPVRVETYDDGALLYLMEMIEDIMPAPTPALQD